MALVTYKVRWFLLVGVFMGGVNKQFTMTVFSMANEEVAQYFNVTNYEVDLLSIGDTFLGILVCLLLAIFGKIFQLRAQFLILGICMTAGNLLTAIAFMNRNLYACIIIGRLLSGCAGGVSYVLPATFANKWFPPSQIATAISITLVGFSTGGVASSNSIPHLIPTEEPSTLSENGLKSIGITFAIVFWVWTGLLSVASIFFCISARNNPPSPPSESEAFIKTIQTKTSFEFGPNLRVSLKLLEEGPFLLITAAAFLSNSVLVLFLVLMPSLIAATFPDLDLSVIGYMTAPSFACAIISTTFAGRLLDKYGSYKTFSCFGTFNAIIFGTGLYLGHLYKSFVSLCIFYPLAYLSRTFTLASFMEFLVEVTYPKDKTVVTSMYFSFYNSSFFVATSLQRLALSKCGPNCALLVPIFASICSLGCLSLVKPDYKRSRVNATNYEDKTDDETIQA